MKPFNLQEALAGKPVVTRDGRAVKQIAHFPEAKHNAYKLYALISEANQPIEYYENGAATLVRESCTDLFMAPVKVTMWVNVRKSNEQGRPFTASNTYDSEAAAINGRLTGYEYICTYPIEIEL